MRKKLTIDTFNSTSLTWEDIPKNTYLKPSDIVRVKKGANQHEMRKLR